MSSPIIADLTTLRLGGPAREVIETTTTEAMEEALTRADDAGDAVLVVGGGSNLVVADEGFDGVVVRIGSDTVEFGTDDDRPFVTADAGVTWDALVARTIAEGFGGLECLSGIPGSTGATPVQNVGAYGVEIADALRAVEIYDRAARSLVWHEPRDLDLRYRHSNLKFRDDRIVTRVSLWLRPGGVSAPLTYRELARELRRDDGQTAAADDVREAVLRLRRSKGMVLDADDPDTYSAGSFFTNPIVSAREIAAVIAQIAVVVGPEVVIPQFASGEDTKLSAGWLIERAGFTKGYPGPDAPVRLSTKHTLALTNRGSATTADLLALAREVRDGVHARFGVALTPEPVFVNCRL
ncbi:UDP-N-acetylenolpyruvoylglucosamine reductase [Gordonia araii NBRC 100433]|uniref:UDP-N-acetylenolpyruvoylglucosamine reductase n=1 Tax=Gordonia araii NBRC 100433 TaxID=1073574 RepID=G7H708_9ACTN|nr:UDP-N-acetylmuramate dehydrogenase [Gordonia araii]GAB11633.1 UDP-N-acetylenolpyruvoylglucosamine reductase [Gordonia araii NBRC 100433]